VEEVNSRLEDEPGLVNKSPEADGWLCTIKLSTPGEFETLLSEEAYKKFTEEL
jgi:glycine cleavage system H protein